MLKSTQEYLSSLKKKKKKEKKPVLPVEWGLVTKMGTLLLLIGFI